MNKVRSFLGLVMLLLCNCAPATPVSYRIELFVQSVRIDSPCDAIVAPGHFPFGCFFPGERFAGRFDIDDSILTKDGEYFGPLPISNYYQTMGASFYSQNPPHGLLSEFRTGQGFGSSFGVVVKGGDVVDLIGGVLQGDDPYIDFYMPNFLARNRFVAYDGRIAAFGTLSVFRVSEPGTVVLALLAVLLAGLAARGFLPRSKIFSQAA